MATLYLVRHGARHAFMGDPGLTDAGRGQALEVATMLRRVAPSAIYASPLRRAVETADVIAAALGVPIAVEPLLRERANWGDVPRQSFEDFVALWERCSRDREFAPPGLDSARAAGARLEAFATRCIEAHGGASIVAVTHGGLITDYLCNAFQPQEIQRAVLSSVMDERRAPGPLDFDPILGSGISECSLTVVRHDGRRWHLEAVGRHAVVPHEALS